MASAPVIHDHREPLGQAEVDQFRFVDLFAGIGGMRGGLERAGGQCVFSVELDQYARLTYEANWGELDATDIREVPSSAIPEHEILAAGFPCQPFSLAGVSKKRSLGRAHGFDDPTSGNLFFEIVRLIGGPWQLSPHDLTDEAEAPDEEDGRFLRAPALAHSPPILLLENVRHLLSHDNRRTYRVIRRRLMRSGYHVRAKVINGAAWVPQNRRRTVIVAARSDLYSRPVELPEPPSSDFGPKLSLELLEKRPEEVARYRLTPGVWAALMRHKDRHASAGHGFGFGIAELGNVTRTLSARYYKDGAEILVRMPDGSMPPRRLTPVECSRLMGFTAEHLGRDFIIPESVSDAQAYRQFGNSVVVPQFTWIANEIVAASRPVFGRRVTTAKLVA